MSESVVDVLEVVDVEIQKCRRGSFPAGAGQHLAGPVDDRDHVLGREPHAHELGRHTRIQFEPATDTVPEAPPDPECLPGQRVGQVIPLCGQDATRSEHPRRFAYIGLNERSLGHVLEHGEGGDEIGAGVAHRAQIGSGHHLKTNVGLVDQLTRLLHHRLGDVHTDDIGEVVGQRVADAAEAAADFDRELLGGWMDRRVEQRLAHHLATRRHELVHVGVVVADAGVDVPDRVLACSFVPITAHAIGNRARRVRRGGVRAGVH